MSGRPVNLMPWRERRQARCRRFWIVFFVVASAGVLFITLMLRANARAERQVAFIWLQADTEVLNSMSSLEPQLLARHEQSVQLQARAKQREATRAWHTRLSILAERLPASAWLTSLHFRQGRLELAGSARTFAALSEFEQRLGLTEGFRLRQTGSTERDAQGNWQFHYQLDKETE